MEVIEKLDKVTIKDVKKFNLDATFSCGQAFRWKKFEKGFVGTACSEQIYVYYEDCDLVIENTNIENFYDIWKNYFSFDQNYFDIEKNILESKAATMTPILKGSIKRFHSIKILKQDPWEVLCSFIISQNNNIPRITKIIEEFCKNFGAKSNKPLKYFGENYLFPNYQTVSQLTAEDLSVIKSGFRAKYIIDAAKKLSSGEVSLLDIEKVSNAEAKDALMKIRGVGPKIAECVLLFGFNRLDAFPMDVWMKKIMQRYFSNESPKIFGKYAGVAQQYLYHYARTVLKL